MKTKPFVARLAQVTLVKQGERCEGERHDTQHDMPRTISEAMRAQERPTRPIAATPYPTRVIAQVDAPFPTERILIRNTLMDVVALTTLLCAPHVPKAHKLRLIAHGLDMLAEVQKELFRMKADLK